MANDLPQDAKPFEFTGNAPEWFGIWIVNLLLSIVTIGIYSAWAKVRTKKYFYNHTFVDGRNFDYHATGGQILKGRLIVIAALVVYNILLTAAPILGLIFMFALFLAVPWLVLRSIIFNARMSSFSNVRFGFDGTVGQAMLLMLVYPIGVFLSLYTTYPILDRAYKRWTILNARLGGARFAADFPLGAFYRAFGAALAWIVAVGMVSFAIFGMNFASFADAVRNVESDPFAFFQWLGLIYVLFFAAFLPAGFIYQAMTRNVVYNNITLEGGHSLASNVSAPALLWIAVSNAIVVLATFFLMLPWAKVRLTRYLAAHTGYRLGSSLDELVGSAQASGTAIGDAYVDLDGIGTGLPI